MIIFRLDIPFPTHKGEFPRCYSYFFLPIYKTTDLDRSLSLYHPGADLAICSGALGVKVKKRKAAQWRPFAIRMSEFTFSESLQLPFFASLPIRFGKLGNRITVLGLYPSSTLTKDSSFSLPCSKISNNRYAGPVGCVLPVSHASTVFFDTPI